MTAAAAMVGGGYLIIAIAGTVVAARRNAVVGAWSGAAAYLVVGALWPFLLPGIVAAPPSVVRKSAGPYAERLDALTAALAAALDDPATAALLARPRAEIEEGVRRLEAEARRLDELDRAIASALPAAQPRLIALRSRAEAQIAERARLLEEVAAQLTVLRFVDLSAPDGAREEKVRVESLLAQLDALVALGTV